MIRSLALALGIVFSGASHALTGNELSAQCADGPTSDLSRCLSYIDGVTDGASDMAIQYWMIELFAQVRIAPYGPKNLPDLHQPFCFPERVTLGQLRNIVLAWFRDNPSETHKPAAGLIRLAMHKAFPCPVK